MAASFSKEGRLVLFLLAIVLSVLQFTASDYLQNFLWNHKTILTSPLFIKISVLKQERERNVECICV